MARLLCHQASTVTPQDSLHGFALVITRGDYHMGRDDEFADELRETAGHAYPLLARAGLATKVNFGWFRGAVDAAIPNAAERSKNMVCLATELEDETFGAWYMAHLEAPAEISPRRESPSATPHGCHVQIVMR